MNDVTYHYHYDGSNLIRITDDNGQTVWAFTWNDGEPVSLTNRNGETFFYITNHRGDVVRIVDENGTPVASYSYDPWGKPLSPEPTDARIAGQPIRYAGYVYDVETQLYYLQARYYDPETARFLSRDPVIGTEDLPLTQNPYIYAVDNPVMMTDPDGQHPLVVAVIVVGGRQVVIYYAKKQIKKKAYKLVRKQVKKKVKGTGNVAHNATQYAKLKTHYKQWEKYGKAGIRELPDERIRYYGKITPASKPGEMAGRRVVREWNPTTGQKRTWHETVDHNGRIIQVRPDTKFTGGVKVHYRFDSNGNYIGKW
ncbi:MAG TPA: RHS repeat-associated core domain-containing protein [Anoxybacillus sp.]|nr:RHS repeat-associated core domain-containing protein [Anoxybacillus sp.]